MTEAKALPIDHSPGVKTSGPWRHRAILAAAIAGAVYIEPNITSLFSAMGKLALPASICGLSIAVLITIGTIHKIIERR
ncbi:MAG: hypothetical protein HN534_01140 [Euryarchaeota archaeon]|jgi:hypothetical protein|nr:hypothetical protein [Euryarchaeota archaeon]MBT3653526.1 hypothetical protein [Euryarchaeota archaeon]MBT3757630.1 hypothetical protein [Euryarchaeota archaeon]MBT4050910.1 hypothetical protein [Euryarchaeota archaeon]MBT4346510.1 hypothetical protein [Euryarchaeota archaeon]